MISRISQIFCLFSIFILSCGSSFTSDAKVDKGKVIYTFESGMIECLSQVDPHGKIVVLIESVKENTEVDFTQLFYSKKKMEYMLQAMITVKEDTDLCASWTNLQVINIVIDPMEVSAITLTGKEAFTSDEITVLISPTKKLKGEF